MQTKFIFITGGVVSSLGKGIAAASIGAILKSFGYSITIKKLDPYLNVDPGTMNPNQHGEVFVTADGYESDLDLGHYERFTQQNTNRNSNITSGQLYLNLIENERKGAYNGETVQVIPHVSNLIKDFITKNSNKYDFVIVEIGGTVGDIEGKPFLEAIRQLRYDIGSSRTMLIHLTLIPYLSITSEIKTKPTQYSVRDLMYSGIEPNILLCRSQVPIPDNIKKKISIFTNIHIDSIVEAPDSNSIYALPHIYLKNGLMKAIAKYFKLKTSIDIEDNKNIVNDLFAYSQKLNKATTKKTILVAGKYLDKNDCYKSLFEAIQHAAVANNVQIEIKWHDTKTVDQNLSDVFSNVHGVIVPGGFGNTGVEGKIAIIKYARENKIPFFGICYGMQLAVIEFTRNVLGLATADSTEINPKTDHPLVLLMSEWTDENGKKQKRDKKSDIGGTMRLGNYESIINSGSLAYKIYNSNQITERHRHRYEINYKYVSNIENAGGVFSAYSALDAKRIPEIFELPTKKHPFFIGCQFHPEFCSTPLNPHPLFLAFIKAL